ncbi:hypothetical protein H4683_002548 [Filibacter limicola]|uniref:Uncharacterized protein n=1 Tax=Sporosarcina limicola TaxID=34101 RepID=A0A927MIX7_9BACL|nr:hypothetical protein [Sporosarcina limicola]
MFTLRPIIVGDTSPRITVLNQTEDSGPIVTSPVIVVKSAMKTDGSIFGVFSL